MFPHGCTLIVCDACQRLKRSGVPALTNFGLTSATNLVLALASEHGKYFACRVVADLARSIGSMPRNVVAWRTNRDYPKHRQMLLNIAATWESLANDRIKTAEGLERIAKLEKAARKGPQPSEYAC